MEAGGAEGFAANLGVSLAGLGHSVRFYLMAGARRERGRVLLERLRKAGVDVAGAKEHNIRSPMNILRLAGLICSWRPDIVQANLYQAEVLVAIARCVAVGHRARYVRRLTGADICTYRSQTVVRLMDFFFRKTIACSPAVDQSYQSFMRGRHRSELVTIPNGGLLREVTPTAEEKQKAREQLALPAGAFIVAHIGRFLGGALGTGLESEPKAQDVLLKAFAQAFKDKPDHLLVMVGDGPIRSKAEALARELGISAQARFLGQQPEPWPALAAADMFCFPSRSEGLPNVLPEAASCGLPVVASDIPEIAGISPGPAWLLKPVDDVEAFAGGLREVAAKYAVYRPLAEAAAPQIRQRFSMAVCAEQYVRVYESVLGP